jgi:hypothetical protein
MTTPAACERCRLNLFVKVFSTWNNQTKGQADKGIVEFGLGMIICPFSIQSFLVAVD